MANNFVKFYDSCDLRPLEVPQEVKDYYNNLSSADGAVQPLRIHIAATHAGKVTRNNGFYLPAKMAAGVASFTAQYPKPIQVHHQDKQDPIGRVVEAKYIDLSRGFRSQVNDSYSDKQYRLLQDFVDGRLSHKDACAFATKFIIADATLSADPDFEGLGYIELVADITSATAIQKILDRRYLTGSTGASTNKAVCSVCKQDWAEEGKCDHKPGRLYDGAKCVLIAGDLTYDEWSFVNKPADRHSRVIEVNINGIQDFVTMDEQQDTGIPEITLVADKSDHSEEDQNMTFKDALELARKSGKFDKVEKLEDKVKALVDEHKDLDEAKLFELLGDKPEEQTTDDTNSDALELFWGDEYKDVVGDDTWGKDYADMMFTLMEDAETDEQKEAAKQLVMDAKLSSAQRKKLSGSTFCGPDRSFPVNDCAHYTAALRLLNRYKGPGSKSSIRACIMRKGKRMGCGSKDEATEENKFNLDYFDHFEDQDLLDLHAGLLAAIKERELECPVKTDEAKVAELEKALEDAKKAVDADIQERLDTARKEIRYLHGDIEQLMDGQAGHVAALHSALMHHILDLHVLSKKDIDIQEVSAELKGKTVDELKTQLAELSTQVDTKEIADTMNSGLSNAPTGEVKDPTLTQDNTNKTEEKKPVFDAVIGSQVKLNWLQIRTNHGVEKADKYLQDCIAQGLVPEDFGATSEDK